MKKRLNKFICVLFILFFFLNCCSCSVSTRYFYDIDDYDEIWELSGYGVKEDGALPIFPSTIKNLNVIDFFCRYDELIPLGEEIQIYLQIKYENYNEFKVEKERIESIAFVCTDRFDNSKFIPYCVKMGNDYTLEYALVNENESEIYYIYINNLSRNEIEFDSKFLPLDY